jgi:hypothetical protein
MRGKCKCSVHQDVSSQSFFFQRAWSFLDIQYLYNEKKFHDFKELEGSLPYEPNLSEFNPVLT